MPNRIIKESICTSDEIDRLSWFEEAVFYRLIVNCDDYGRFDGRLPIIKNRLFPLKDTLTPQDIEKAVSSLADAGLIDYYRVNEKPYLQLCTWDRHQQIRAKKSKYPAKPGDARASDIRCVQAVSDVPVIQSESESESNPIREDSSPARKKYGEHKNVLLTDSEYRRLCEKLPSADAYIERLSGYIASKGASYRSHYATILSWERRDRDAAAKAGGQATPGGSFDTDDFFERSLEKSMEEAQRLLGTGKGGKF